MRCAAPSCRGPRGCRPKPRAGSPAPAAAPPSAAAAAPAAGSSPASAAESRRALFNTIAPTYDVLNDVLSLGAHRLWKAAAVQWARPAPGAAALDVCCGSGDVALRLAAAVGPGGRVVGLDFAAAQLAVAAAREAPLLLSQATQVQTQTQQQQQQQQQQAGRCAVEWVEGDALALPFGDASFDCATCGYGLRNVLDPGAALAQLARVLRPGGRAAVLDFCHSESGATTALQSLLLDALVVPAARAAGVAPEYEYLKGSIAAFPTGRQLVGLGRGAGFSAAVYHELAAGLMGCLVCTR